MNHGSMRTSLFQRKRGERGATMVLFTMLIALVIVPFVGLAIDGSIAFWARAKLSAAVDAAALAAGRSINMTQDLAANQTPVIAVGQAWFLANFPTGWLGTTVLNNGPLIVPSTAAMSTQQVSVTASASVPLYFLRVAGFNSMTVSATATSSRRSTYVVLVLDRSLSMSYNSAGNACPAMQQASVKFVNMFTERFDTLSLVTYSSTAGPNPDVLPTVSFKTPMATTINKIQCGGFTSMAQALNVAYQSIKTTNLPLALNVIVLFTDGQPNELVGTFPIKTSADTRYGSGSLKYPSVNALYSWPASTCTSDPSTPGYITGGLTAPVISPPSARWGLVLGLFDYQTQVPVSISASTRSPTNCASNGTLLGPPYTSSLGALVTQFPGADIRGDIASVPTTDYYRNKTNAGYGVNSPYYGPSVGTSGVPDVFSTPPYANYMRPDEENVGVTAAAVNVADYQAQAIRADTTYNPVIYTIGLGGAPDLPIDATLLERIANDPRSPIYDSSKATGFFAYASDPSQLNQAFTQVAGQILRLSK
jgi:Flp pilus assembly protein TadG